MIKIRKLSLILFVLVFTGVFGCVYTASFSRSTYINQSALSDFLASKTPVKPEDVKFFESPPAQEFVILGTLHAPQVEWTAHYDTDDLIKAMQKKAAKIGADAILDFRTKANPTTHIVWHIYSVTAVPFKGLHAWGEAIIFVSGEQKRIIESQ